VRPGRLAEPHVAEDAGWRRPDGVAVADAEILDAPEARLLQYLDEPLSRCGESPHRGVALIVESVTDNRNRTVADLRHLFSKNGGNLAESGAVSWNFERKGVITVQKGGYSEDDLMNVILEAGADDLKDEGEYFEVTAALESFEPVRKAIESSGLPEIAIENAALQYVPKTTTRIEGKDAEQTVKLINAVEDNDDVQNVFTNADIDEKVLEAIG
jgi:YebC/PmpR family DNA-binding regulatory protein